MYAFSRVFYTTKLIYSFICTIASVFFSLFDLNKCFLICFISTKNKHFCLFLNFVENQWYRQLIGMSITGMTLFYTTQSQIKLFWLMWRNSINANKTIPLKFQFKQLHVHLFFIFLRSFFFLLYFVVLKSHFSICFSMG